MSAFLSDDEAAALRSVNNPNGEPTGHFTGRCMRCGSTKLWDDNMAYGCECCGAFWTDIKPRRLMIVKVQRPLGGMTSTDDGMHRVLIYNEDRSFECFIWMAEEELGTLFPDGAEKVYMQAYIEGEQMGFIERVVDQPW